MKTWNQQTDDELRESIIMARAVLATRAGKDDRFGAIKGQEHCKRALIVAGVQGHAVVVYGPQGCGKSMLVLAGLSIGIPVFELSVCPCGNFTDPRRACPCDADAIKEHWRAQKKYVDKCDIHVEVPPVPFNELASKRLSTTIKQAQEQIQRAIICKLPSRQIDELDDPSRQILRQATTELGLSASTIITIMSIAASVAALAQSNKIKCDHICEAIHYRRLDRQYL